MNYVVFTKLRSGKCGTFQYKTEKEASRFYCSSTQDHTKQLVELLDINDMDQPPIRLQRYISNYHDLQRDSAL